LFAEPIGVLDRAALVLYVSGTNDQVERRIVMAGKFELYKGGLSHSPGRSGGSCERVDEGVHDL